MTITIPPSTASYTLSANGTTATNAGTRGQSINGQSVGIYISGSNDTLVNTGTIIGGYTNSGTSLFAGVAVNTATGDSVTNQVGGLIENTYALAAGIVFYNAQGTVTNAGTIIGGVGTPGGSGDGIALWAGGSVTNLSTGTISGGGVYDGTRGVAGTVTNAGKILGDSVYGGVYMKVGGTVTNLAGTIASNGAAYGIKIVGGAGTVTNAATITGGSASGAAIILSAVAGNRLIDQSGGVFIGTVNGGSGATMELTSAASAGTLTATGGQFSNFSGLYIDSGARWTINGDSGLAAEFPVIGGFTVGDTISLTGLSQTPTTFSSSTAVNGGTTTTSVIIEAGSTGLETLTLLGSIASSQFSFAAGSTSTLTEGPSTPPPNVTISLVDDTSGGHDDTSNDALTGGGDANGVVTLTENSNTLGTATANGSGTWTFTPSVLDQGSNIIVASETNAGGTGSASVTFTYDTIAPAVAESLVSDTGNSNSDKVTSNDAVTGGGDANAVVNLTEGVSSIGTATANGSGTWTFTPSVLGQGSNTIVASETDLAGNTGSATLTFTYDTVAPTVTSDDTVQPSSNSGGTEQFTVDFSESVSGVDTSDFTLADTGTVGGTISSVSSSSGSSITVTVTGVTAPARWGSI
jgi:hypothetical protein